MEWSFSCSKNGISETNIPPAMQVVGDALAYRKKPPMIKYM